MGTKAKLYDEGENALLGREKERKGPKSDCQPKGAGLFQRAGQTMK